MSARSYTRSKKKLQSTSTPRLIHKLLWVSALIHSLGLNSIPEKNGQISKPPRYFNRGKTWGNKAKSSAHEQRASILKQAIDPEKLGAFMFTSTNYKKPPKKLNLRQPYDGILANPHIKYNINHPSANRPSINELQVLKEQLETELEKREKRNQRYSVSRSAHRSHLHSTQKVKHGSMSHQHKTSHR